MLKRLVWLLTCFILLTACSVSGKQATVRDNTTPVVATSDLNEQTVEPTATQVSNEIETAVINTPQTPLINPRQQDGTQYNVNYLIPFDGIHPIYEPLFVIANEAPYQDDELVMGVAFGNEAKAYPVSVLSFREMVNDEIANIPILVTW